VTPVPASVLLEFNPSTKADLALRDLCGLLFAHGIFAAGAIVWGYLWQLRISLSNAYALVATCADAELVGDVRNATS
jgi:hypothetical protein